MHPRMAGAATLAAALLLPTIALAESEDASPRRAPFVAVRVNPLALLIGRKSADVEVWPVPWLSVVGTVFITNYAETKDAQADYSSYGGSTQLTLNGFELGARYWHWLPRRAGTASSTEPTAGLFFGASGSSSWGSESFTSEPYSGAPDAWQTAHEGSRESIRRTAVAAELGAALLYRPFFAAGGLGLQYTRSTFEPDGAGCERAPISFCISGTPLYHGDGFRPRFLLSVGLAL